MEMNLLKSEIKIAAPLKNRTRENVALKFNGWNTHTQLIELVMDLRKRQANSVLVNAVLEHQVIEYGKIMKKK